MPKPTLEQLLNAGQIVCSSRDAGGDYIEEFVYQHDLLGIRPDDDESSTKLAEFSGFAIATNITRV